MRALVNGAVVETTGARDLECDYCGGAGHTYHRHSEALQDVREWTREVQAETNR